MKLTDIIERGEKETPDRPALIFRDRIISYSKLSNETKRLAGGLSSLGLGKGDRVALLLPNIPPFVYAYYAASYIGATAVPANPLLKPPELAYIWKDADIKAVITSSSLLPGVIQACKELPNLSHVISVSDHNEFQSEVPGLISFEALLSKRHKLECVDIDENDCAVIIYTSGTTGHPKGAMLSHKNLIRNVEQIREILKISPNDVFLTILPLFHSFAGTVCMNLALSAGAASVLVESFHPGKAIETTVKRRVTIFASVPAHLNALLLSSPDTMPDPAKLRFFLSGGSALPVSTLEAVEALYRVPVIEGYGPTECSPVTSVNPFEGIRKPGSVGLPLPGVEVAIFDDFDQSLKPEEIGEIVVRGDNVMLGYLNQPEATEEAFRGGWYHTGDIGKLDSDGYLFILDRKKDMVITAGMNVYPREVEEVLLKHPAVADAAVIGLSDALRGEEVTAVIVLRPESEPVSERSIIRHCRTLLADYKSPRRVLFRSDIPRSAAGKALKRLLKKELEHQQIIEVET